MKRHCHRRKETLHTEWFTAAAALPGDWDESLPEKHFLRRSCLQVHESTHLPDVNVYYALFRCPEGILARAAFQGLRAQPQHLSDASLPAWQFRLWRLFTKTIRPRLLVGGQLFRHDVETVQWDASMSSFDAYEWYRSALETAADKSHAAAMLLKDLPEPLLTHFLHGAPEFLLLRNDISMQLSIPGEWNTIADYEKSLKHKYAQRFRKVRQSWEGLELRELNAGEVNAASDRIYALYRQVTDRQSVRLGFLSKSFIPMLKSAYDPQLKVWGIYEGTELIAFASGWARGDSFDMFYIGFDYERNSALNLYFNILFLAIEQAILLKKSRLILGRTALEAKARVGCRPLYLNTFLHIRNPMLRNIVARLQVKLADNNNEWEQRHPFKGSQI